MAPSDPELYPCLLPVSHITPQWFQLCPSDSNSPQWSPVCIPSGPSSPGQALQCNQVHILGTLTHRSLYPAPSHSAAPSHLPDPLRFWGSDIVIAGQTGFGAWLMNWCPSIPTVPLSPRCGHKEESSSVAQCQNWAEVSPPNPASPQSHHCSPVTSPRTPWSPITSSPPPLWPLLDQVTEPQDGHDTTD